MKDNLFIKHQQIDKKIENDVMYHTISNPYILVNPYEINPLTAIVGFKINKKAKYSYKISKFC